MACSDKELAKTGGSFSLNILNCYSRRVGCDDEAPPSLRPQSENRLQAGRNIYAKGICLNRVIRESLLQMK